MIRIPVDGDLCVTILTMLVIKPVEIGGEAEEARDVKSKRQAEEISGVGAR